MKKPSRFTMGKAVSMIAIAVSVSGCAPKQAILKLDAPVVNVVTKNVVSPAVKRLVIVPFETRLKSEGVSVKCRLETAYYTASFTSPANLRLPDYGKETPVIKVACQGADGGISGSKRVIPENTQTTNAGMVGAVLLGPIGAAIAAGVAHGNDGDYFYRRIILRMK